MGQEQVLAFGTFQRGDRLALAELAHEAGLEVEYVENVEQAAQWLATHQPRLLLVDGTTEDASTVCQLTRSKAERMVVPIIRVAQELDDLSFEEVFNWGGDDVIQLGVDRSLVSRVRALPANPPLVAGEPRGIAVVADSSRTRRLVRARVLRNAGYAVRFAVSAAEAARFAAENTTQVLVVDLELEGAEEIVLACQQHAHVKLVLLCPPRMVARLAKQFDGKANLAVSDSFAPPENVLFILNELQLGSSKTQRTSRRVLYGTIVSFRGEGREQDDHGFSYNISGGGLFVRTLAPPTDDLVWLELRPPRTDRKVRLEGEVTWRQHFGSTNHATTPPGFGVRITDATPRNMQAWLAGYQEFGSALGLSRQFISRAS